MESTTKDTGLSKKGLQEVQAIVSDAIHEIKQDFDKQFKELKSDTKSKWENMGEFKANVYQHFESIEKTLINLKWKHDWRTAMWVFLGSATPVAIGVLFFFLKVK